MIAHKLFLVFLLTCSTYWVTPTTGITLNVNLCLLTNDEMEAFYSCALKSLQENVRKEVEKLKDVFPGLGIGEIASMLCKSGGDNHEVLVDEFFSSVEEQYHNITEQIANKCLENYE